MSLWKLVLQKAIQQTLLYLPPEDPVARAQMHWNKFSQREREISIFKNKIHTSL